VRVACAREGTSGRIAETSAMLTWTSMRCPHLRHFMRMVFPATFSSGIWYFALQFSQLNFIR
jgi:hypothetical protein